MGWLKSRQSLWTINYIEIWCSTLLQWNLFTLNLLSTNLCLQFIQVSGLFMVWFRQVSLYYHTNKCNAFESMCSFKQENICFLLSSSSPREQLHTPSPPTPLSFLSSFSVLVQFTHINVRNIYIHACSIK